VQLWTGLDDTIVMVCFTDEQ